MVVTACALVWFGLKAMRPTQTVPERPESEAPEQAFQDKPGTNGVSQPDASPGLTAAPAVPKLPTVSGLEDLPTLIGKLMAAGLEGDVAGPAALCMYERTKGRLSVEERLRVELAIEDALIARGVDVPVREWDFELRSLSDNGRRVYVKESLRSFDVEMRELQRKYARGEVEGSDYFERWDSLRQRRQNELMALLTPAERDQWIIAESPEAKNLRELPLKLKEGEFKQVVLLKWEAAQRLADPALPDAARSQIQASLSQQLKTLLREDGYTRLERAEDPRYEAYAELGPKLGLSEQTADTVFDWQRYVQRTETDLRTRGLSDDDVMQQMRAVVAQATEALQGSMPADQWTSFMTLPQATFLLAYQPLELEQ